MSRIGKQPIAIPAGVNVTLAEGNTLTVNGPNGEMTRSFHPIRNWYGTPRMSPGAKV